MRPTDLDEIRELVATRLPRSYDPLLLTFYGRDAREVNGGEILIGNDYGTELRVRSADGVVLSVDPQGKLPTRFVNSGVEQLARFLEVVSAVDRGDDRDGGKRSMRDRLRAIDPPAFADAENWWSLVLEQVRLESDG
jgi:hypothetical protein